MNLRVEKKIIDNYRVRAVWYSVWKEEEKLFETTEKKEIKKFIKEKFHGDNHSNDSEGLERIDSEIGEEQDNSLSEV